MVGWLLCMPHYCHLGSGIIHCNALHKSSVYLQAFKQRIKASFYLFFSKKKLKWGTRGTCSMWHVCKHTRIHCCLFPHAYLLHDACAQMCVETPQTIPVLNCVCDSKPSCQFEACQTRNPAPATSSWFIPIHFCPSFSCSSSSPFPCILAAALNKHSTYHPEK